MKVKLFTLLTVACLTIGNVSFGGISPEAKEVIDSYIEATGGTEAKQAIKSLIFKGNYSMPAQGIEAPITLHFKSPFKLSTTIDIPNIGMIRSGYDGEIGWEMNPVTGFRTISGSELEQLSKQATVFPELKLEENYKSVERKEDKPNGDIVLKLIGNNDYDETWVFNPTTHLLTEMSMIIDAGAQGSFPINNRFEDYTSYGNIKLATKTTTSNPAFSMVIAIDEVKIDEDIADDLFEQPSNPQ